MVEGAGLENRNTGNGIGGSNPFPSATVYLVSSCYPGREQFAWKQKMCVYPCGEMAEWLKAHAWKACIGLSPIGGSNPPLSVYSYANLAEPRFA